MDSCTPLQLHRSSSISNWLPCSPLGSGSFGHVSLAINLDDSSLFAVKSPLSSSPSELLALLNELLILQSLHSPFIIRCLGADFSIPSAGATTPPTIRNLFLEYMDGGSLADFIKQSSGGVRCCEEMQARRFTRSILQGLAYMHENGIVHGDIKSQNILIGSSGVKIADFGTARRLGGEVAVKKMSGGKMRGTPLWMAPEVALGGEPMPESDIWSLGCTVVEMLQGRPPWGEVSSVAAALFKVGCSSDIPPLPESISAEARDFLLSCLQRDAKERGKAAELLKHPFVCGYLEEEEERCWIKEEQASPRSTLDFCHSSDSESDGEDELFLSTIGPVPMLCSAPRRTTPGFSARILSQGSDWIVVKRSERWCAERQPPFMLLQSQAEDGFLPVTRGSQVSFASAEFLKTRRVKHLLVR